MTSSQQQLAEPSDRPVFLLLGGSGQLGRELERALTPLGRVLAPPRGIVDFRSADSIRQFVADTRPTVIVNAAAYTDVDRAEFERDRAFAVNAEAPEVLAESAHRVGAGLIHFSTDYVFDGTKAEPYRETDEPRPLNAYGESKLQGENAIAAGPAPWIVIRTSWLYCAHGRNFLNKILSLARERDEIRVVSDQIGSPTSGHAVADAMVKVLEPSSRWETTVEKIRRVSGIYHMTAGGSTSWFGFACAILASDPDRHDHRCSRVTPIRSEDYDAPALRPRRTVLDNHKFFSQFRCALDSWETQLAAVLRR